MTPRESAHVAGPTGKYPEGGEPDDDEEEDLLTPSEVAQLFGVDPKTVTRWANVGYLHPIRTLGGHRRYRAGEIRRLLEEAEPDDD